MASNLRGANDRYGNDQYDDEEEESCKPTFFTGRSQKLTDEATLPEPSLQAASPLPQSATQQVATRTLTFWQNGFTVSENGPLYQYNNPESHRVLSLLQTGHAPLQLLNVEPGQRVDLRVSHLMDQDFEPPKAAPTLFSGKGQRLGDFAEPVKRTNSPSSMPSTVPLPSVDASRPTTVLQLRLADGTRHNTTFNIDATVSQLHDHVSLLTGRRSTLLAGRPPVQLEANDSRSLAEASLLHTVIIQQ